MSLLINESFSFLIEVWQGIIDLRIETKGPDS